MRVAVFPFEIKRIDDTQGVLGRQVPRTIVEALRAAGIASERPQWHTRAGDGAAHVTVEAPLPTNVVREVCEALTATHAVLGRVHVTGHRAFLALALAPIVDAPRDEASDAAPDADDDATETAAAAATEAAKEDTLEATTLFEDDAPRDALPTLIREATAALIEALTGAAPPAPDDDAPTLEAWLVDAIAEDGRDLEEAQA